MLGGADNPNGELPSYITGANTGAGPLRLSGHPRWKGSPYSGSVVHAS